MWSSTMVFFLLRESETTTALAALGRSLILSLSVVSMIGGRSRHIGLVEQASGWIVGFAISLLMFLAFTRIGSMSSLAGFVFRPLVMVCVGWSGMASVFMMNSIICCFRRRWSGISPQSTCRAERLVPRSASEAIVSALHWIVCTTLFWFAEALSYAMQP